MTALHYYILTLESQSCTNWCLPQAIKSNFCIVWPWTLTSWTSKLIASSPCKHSNLKCSIHGVSEQKCGAGLTMQDHTDSQRCLSCSYSKCHDCCGHLVSGGGGGEGREDTPSPLQWPPHLLTDMLTDMPVCQVTDAVSISEDISRGWCLKSWSAAGRHGYSSIIQKYFDIDYRNCTKSITAISEITWEW